MKSENGYPSADTFSIENSGTYGKVIELIPANARSDLRDFYRFVRKADEFVDQEKQNGLGLQKYIDTTFTALHGTPSNDPIINNFVKVSKKRNFTPEWIAAFFSSMQADLSVTRYNTFADVEEYVYGSAGVIGYMFASILSLPQEAYPYAKRLGHAFQWANIIRDIGEDIKLGRVYLPQEDLQRFGVSDITPQIAHTQQFADLIDFQIIRQREMTEYARNGFRFLPVQTRLAVEIAAKLYESKLRKIAKDPPLVFRKMLLSTTNNEKMLIATRAAMRTIFSASPRKK